MLLPDQQWMNSFTTDTTVPLAGYLHQAGYAYFSSIVFFVCLLATLHKKFWTDFREIFLEGRERATTQVIIFWW